MIERIRLHYARLIKYKTILFMKNNEFVSIIEYKAKDTKESEMSHRKFRDMCNFTKDNVNTYKPNEDGIINELSISFPKLLILAISLKCYIYDFKLNTMRDFPSLNYDHEGGVLLYIPFDSSIYAISGKTTNTVERIRFSQIEKKALSNWETYYNLNPSRCNFSSFVVNNKIIYILLGYHYEEKKFSTTVRRLDVSHGDWSFINVNEHKSPKLIFSSTIHFCEGGVFVLGGLKNYQEANGTVYLFSYITGTWTTTDFRVHDTNFFSQQNMIDKDFSQSPSMKFSSNTQFTPLKVNPYDNTNSYFFAQFDSNNYCHLINVRSFDHYILFQNEIVEYEESSILDNNKNTNTNANNINIIENKYYEDNSKEDFNINNSSKVIKESNINYLRNLKENYNENTDFRNNFIEDNKNKSNSNLKKSNIPNENEVNEDKEANSSSDSFDAKIGDEDEDNLETSHKNKLNQLTLTKITKLVSHTVIKNEVNSENND